MVGLQFTQRGEWQLWWEFDSDREFDAYRGSGDFGGTAIHTKFEPIQRGGVATLVGLRFLPSSVDMRGLVH